MGVKIHRVPAEKDKKITKDKKLKKDKSLCISKTVS